MSMQLPYGHLATKSGCLVSFDVCKSNHLASHLFQLTRLLPSMFFAEPHLVVLKHYGKGEVLHLIDQMEDCFNLALWVQPRGHRFSKEGERGQCCRAWPVGLWHQYVWEKVQKYQAKASEKSTLNAAMYEFWSDEEYLRVQAYLSTHGGYQLEAVSTGHIPLGRQSSWRWSPY